VRARGRIKTSQKKIRRNNLIMVLTRKSPQKTRPTGVPTLSGQARVRAERAEQRNEQRSAAARANAAASQANAPVLEEAHRPIEEEEVSQLDIVDNDDVYQHGNNDNEEECVWSDTMDVDDDEEEHHYSLVIIGTFLARFMLISTLYVRFMLISAFYADQANYKNSALNAYHQANAVLCLSARLMLISRTIWLFNDYLCGQNLKSFYLESTTFWGTVCPA